MERLCPEGLADSWDFFLGGQAMKKTKTSISFAILAGALLFGAGKPAGAGNEVIYGPVRDEFPFEVDDFNDCTQEEVHWTAVLRTFDYIHVSGNAKRQTMHVVSKFSWDATVEGTATGHIWETKGGGKDTVNYDASSNSPYREVFIENSSLKPVTEGAPRIRFHARIVVKDDGEGGVVESVDYEYHCIGR